MTSFPPETAPCQEKPRRREKPGQDGGPPSGCSPHILLRRSPFGPRRGLQSSGKMPGTLKTIIRGFGQPAKNDSLDLGRNILAVAAQRRRVGEDLAVHHR